MVDIVGRARTIQFHVAAQRRQRGAQFMRGIANETAHLFLFGLRGFDGILQALQHDIQRSRKLPDLRIQRPIGHASVQIALGNIAGGALHNLQWFQRLSDHRERQQRQKSQHEQTDQRLQHRQSTQESVFSLQVLGDDGDHAVFLRRYSAPFWLLGPVDAGNAARATTDHQVVDLWQGVTVVIYARGAIREDMDDGIVRRRAGREVAGKQLGVLRPAVHGLRQVVVDTLVEDLTHHGIHRE